MRKSLSHLPERKREELKKLVELIKEKIDAEFIILFGSYARGDWVKDKSIGEDGNLYEYTSDYDILIVTKNPRRYEHGNYPGRIKRKAEQCGVRTDISMIFHSVAEFKRAVNKGKYFFVDIIKEGVLLYSSERVPLPEIQELNVEEQKYYAQKDFDNWFESAKGFFKQYKHALSDSELKIAVFDLHQAVERFYTTVMLVFTGYKPKLHDLEILDAKTQAFCGELKDIFPKDTQKEKDLFDLLKRAYVEARYNMSYEITKKELEYLAERVRKLQEVTEKICKAKIKNLN
jgi:HEPN domain-containing protein/predicted nucleotidyltransferase